MSQSATLYIIAYDIQDDRRRNRVHKLLSAYGKWTQYSLFECFLTHLQRVELMSRLYPLIEPDDDSLRLYPLCEACIRRVETIGGTVPEDPPLFLL